MMQCNSISLFLQKWSRIQSVSTQCHPNNGEKQEELPYSFEIQPFDDGLLAYWAHYGIYEETLRRFRVRSLRSYASHTREVKPFEVKATPTEPIFAYIGNGYIRYIVPIVQRCVFSMRDRLPSPYCFGMEQIPCKGVMLFITGGEKDVLSLSAHHFHAICFNSETTQIPGISLKVCSCAFGTSSCSTIQTRLGWKNPINKQVY